jgi:hypothetical protein
MTHKPFDLEKAMRNGGKCMISGSQVKIIKAIPEESCAVIGYYPEAGMIHPLKVRFEDLINIPEKRTGWIAHMHSTDRFRCSSPVYQCKKEMEQWLENYAVDGKWVVSEISWEEV